MASKTNLEYSAWSTQQLVKALVRLAKSDPKDWGGKYSSTEREFFGEVAKRLERAQDGV